MMFRSKNKKYWTNPETGEHVPIWHVFIDESGHPYFDESDIGPFAMGAVITDDPNLCSKIVLAAPKKKKSSDGGEELKSSRTDSSTRYSFMNVMNARGYGMVVTHQSVPNQTDYSKENASLVYEGVLSRLLLKIAHEGPDGIYRIYVDDSEYTTQAHVRMIAKWAFESVEGKVLADYKPAGMLDSQFSPPIQSADMLVGGYRRSLKKGKDSADEFVKNNKLMVANAKSRRKAGGGRVPRHRRRTVRIRRQGTEGRSTHPSGPSEPGTPEPCNPTSEWRYMKPISGNGRSRRGMPAPSASIAPRTHVRYGHRDRSIRREREEDRRKESMKEMIRRFGDGGGA